MKKTGFSLAWKSSKKEASEQKDIVIVASGKTNDNVLGEYLAAKILSVNSCEEIKSLYSVRQKTPS